MTEDEKLLIEAIKSDATWINNVLFIGISLCITTLLLKLITKKGKEININREQIEILNIKIDKKYFWLIVFAMTVGHFYCATLFTRDGYRIFYSSYEARRTAFYELSVSGPPFFRGLIPRLCNGSNLIPINGSDPTGWLSNVSAVAIFFSIVRWRRVKWSTRVFSIIIGLILTIANWIIGTNWSLAASELSLNGVEASCFYRNIKPDFGSAVNFPNQDLLKRDTLNLNSFKNHVAH